MAVGEITGNDASIGITYSNVGYAVILALPGYPLHQ